MKNRFLTALLYVAFTAAACPAQDANVSMEGGFLLKGQIEKMTPDCLFLKHEGSEKSLQIPADKIASMAITGSPGYVLETIDRLKLNGSDISIPCRITKITDSEITFTCPFSQKNTLKREQVKSMEIDAKPTRALWAPPLTFGISDWGRTMEASRAEKEKAIKSIKPKQKDGHVTYAIGEFPVDVSKKVNLDSLSFSVEGEITPIALAEGANKNQSLLSLYLTYETPRIPSDGKSGTQTVFLFFDFTSPSLWLSYSIGNESWSRPILPLEWTGGPKQFKIALSPTNPASGKISLDVACSGASDAIEKVSGKNWELPPLAKGDIYFGIKSTGHHQIELADPMLSYVNNAKSKMTGAPSASFDLLETQEDDVVPGQLFSYDSKKKSFAFKIGKDSSITEIGKEYVSGVVLKAVKNSTPLPFEPCFLTTKSGDLLKGTLEKIENGNVTINNAIMGKMSIPLSHVLNMEFFKHPPPVRSQP